MEAESNLPSPEPSSAPKTTPLTATLLIQCEDKKGLVYRLAKFIYERGGNILDSQQHTEELGNRFFMRIVFARGEFDSDGTRLIDDAATLASELGIEIRVALGETRRRIAIMVSRYDHCLYDLLLRQRYGEIDAVVPFVIGNHAELAPAVEGFGIAFHHIPVTPGQKPAAEARALALLAEARIDLIVLARYMQVLSPDFLAAYPMRIINVHHGFLPAFKGARPYHQAYEQGVKLIGATSHYASEDLDMGPIIEQETTRVDHTRSARDMTDLGRDVEKIVLAKAVRAHLADRIMVYRNRTIVFQ